MATIIKTNGERIEVSPKDETEGFTLEELTDIVDGYIEIIRLNDSQIMVINEEGKFNKKMNEEATKMAHENRAIYPNDYICGNALVCDDEQVK